MAHRLIRVWRELDVEDLGRHLLIIGELSAECAHCKAIGINYKEAKQCPQCQAIFR